MKKHITPDQSSNVRLSLHHEFEKTAVRVSMVSIIGNTALSAFKMFAGIFANSGAMISDAVHSASDVFSSIIVIIGIKISAKGSDREHPYGHERFECATAIILAVVLLVSSLFIGHQAFETIASAQTIEVPGVLALIAAVISILSKEAMYWYTRFFAKKFDSGALMADAWHHRSDALSSVGALIGISGARAGIPILDTAASLIICVLIIKTAYDIFKDAIKKMVDRSCDDEIQQEICRCAVQQTDVLGIKSIQTRVFGNRIYVDIIILTDGEATLSKSYEVSKRVHDAIESNFPKVKHITVCAIPFK